MDQRGVELFFPLGPRAEVGFAPGLAVYGRVVANYWPWLVPAAIAERGVLATAFVGNGQQGVPFEPLLAYRNVVRMHMLIFFFAGAYAIGLDNFAVYAVVYAVYFWPWRQRRGQVAAA